MKANPSLLIAPTLLHSFTLTFRGVVPNSGEQAAASRDLQAIHTDHVWSGTQLLSLVVEQPSFNVMLAVDGSHMGLSTGQRC